MTAEVWKDIPSLSDYLASSLGRIMRRPHRCPMPNGGFRMFGGAPWLGAWDSTQNRYTFHHKGTKKTYRVARLVCEAFHGIAPDDKPLALHVDEDSRNNKPNNLKWGTSKENLNAPGFLKYCHGRTGDNSPGRKGRAI